VAYETEVLMSQQVVYVPHAVHRMFNIHCERWQHTWDRMEGRTRPNTGANMVNTDFGI